MILISPEVLFFLSSILLVVSHILTYANMQTQKVFLQTSNITHTLLEFKIVDNSDVVKLSPVGAAPIIPSF